MTFPLFLFTISTVIALSIGQILFKLASASLEFSSSGFWHGLWNIKLISALFVYAMATFMWLFVLKSIPLRVAYPFVALAFIIVPILGHFFLGEVIGWNTFAGALLIGLGVWLAIYR